MANLFIGFPVPRAKIATMIEEAAPPLNHVSNHEPDGSDPIVLPGDISDDQILKWNGTKFIGVDEPVAGAYPSPISIHPSAFIARKFDQDRYTDVLGLGRVSELASGLFYAPVNFPHGATITKLTLYAYREDAASTLTIILNRVTKTGSGVNMASVTADWTDYDGSKYDDSISYATINNTLYSYCVYCLLDLNDSIDDVILTSVQIDFS